MSVLCSFASKLALTGGTLPDPSVPYRTPVLLPCLRLGNKGSQHELVTPPPPPLTPSPPSPRLRPPLSPLTKHKFPIVHHPCNVHHSAADCQTHRETRHHSSLAGLNWHCIELAAHHSIPNTLLSAALLVILWASQCQQLQATSMLIAHETQGMACTGVCCACA